MSEQQTTPHQLILDERRQLHITGVTDVDSYDENVIVAQTPSGELAVKGSSLHICRLNIEAGDLAVEGHITSLEYSDPRPAKGGRLRKLFK